MSNNRFNHHYNTVWILPISSSPKYDTQIQYVKSPMFIPIKNSQVYGTILVQHIRDVDPSWRRQGSCKGMIKVPKLKLIQKLIDVSI